jgi:nitroreductase
MRGVGENFIECDPALRVLATRYSTAGFADTAVQRADIEIALDLAVRAPNHRRTRPWRFAVVRGDALRRLGEQMAAAAIRMGQDGERARSKALFAPAIICVSVSPQLANPRVLEEEEVLAVGAAIQNILLALHARGLGSFWTTGTFITTKEVRDFFDLTSPQDRILGLIYVGYPRDGSRGDRRIETHARFTRWMD